MKKIIFIYGRKLSELPPLIALIEGLNNCGCSCSVVVSTVEGQYDAIAKQIPIELPFPDSSRITRRINRNYRNNIYARHKLSKLCHQYDIIWHVLASGSIEVNTGLSTKSVGDKTTVTSVYEMFDSFPKILKQIAPILRSSQAVIMPEYNRACIYRTWFNLPKLPFVLPNAPRRLPRLEDSDIIELLKKHSSKVILYQGHIMRIRNLDALCDAVQPLKGFEVVLMGKSHDGYAEELCSKYPFVSHIPFIMPPKHLQFTSGAYIGVVTYDHKLLNGVYCAPNKIWEYSGYGVPMICNDIPGLKYTVEQSKAGLCIDMSNAESIRRAIDTIDRNHGTFAEYAKKMFAAVQLDSIISDIIKSL